MYNESGSVFDTELNESNSDFSFNFSNNGSVDVRTGTSPYVGDDGYWYEYSDSEGKFVKTSVKAKGDNGINGTNGVSPTVQTNQTSTGATITIVDTNGTHTATLTNGQDGSNGTNGVSPIVYTEQTNTGAKITITDAISDHTFTIKDGKDGKDGSDGTTPVRGTDYWTDSDKTEIISQTKTNVEADVPTMISEYFEEHPIEVMTISVVAELPATGTANTIYLVPNGETTGTNIYDEYLWINNAYEKIGVIDIDLSQYAKKTDIKVDDIKINNTSIISDGVANIPTAKGVGYVLVYKDNTNRGISYNSNGAPYITKALESDIDGRTNTFKPIVPSNLDYAVKCAMADGVGAAWSDDEKTAARSRMNTQETLTSGTNIKTVNSTSILGSGNIDADNIYLCTYGTTTYENIVEAVNNNKIPVCLYNNKMYIFQCIRSVNPPDVVFTSLQPYGDSSVNMVICYQNDTWKSQNLPYQASYQKASTIVGKEKDTGAYPTTKAVADYSAKKTMISNDYSATTTYAVGDYCIYNYTLWKCISACTGVEPSEGDNWAATNVSSNLGGGGNVLVDNTTITKDSTDTISTIAVKDNTNTATKTWRGTLAQYNAIATKDTNTIYYITDDYTGGGGVQTDDVTITTNDNGELCLTDEILTKINTLYEDYLGASEVVGE